MDGIFLFCLLSEFCNSAFEKTRLARAVWEFVCAAATRLCSLMLLFVVPEKSKQTCCFGGSRSDKMASDNKIKYLMVYYNTNNRNVFVMKDPIIS